MLLCWWANVGDVLLEVEAWRRNLRLYPWMDASSGAACALVMVQVDKANSRRGCR